MTISNNKYYIGIISISIILILIFLIFKWEVNKNNFFLISYVNIKNG
jgi:hypothetical protein